MHNSHQNHNGHSGHNGHTNHHHHKGHNHNPDGINQYDHQGHHVHHGGDGRRSYYHNGSIDGGAPRYDSDGYSMPRQGDYNAEYNHPGGLRRTLDTRIKEYPREQVEESSVDETEGEEKVSWNSADRCVPIKVRIAYEGTTAEFKAMASKHNGQNIRKPMHDVDSIMRVIKSKLQKSASQMNSSHTSVTIEKITIISRSSNLPHDTGILLGDSSGALASTAACILSSDQRVYTYVVPSNCREDTNVNEVVYCADKNIYSELVSALGGLSIPDINKMSYDIRQNSKYKFVPNDSAVAKTAYDTINGIRSGKKGMLDPELHTNPDGTPFIYEEGDEKFIRISRAFFESFIDQYNKDIVSITKPVNLKTVTIEAVNEHNDQPLGSTGKSDPKDIDKRYRLTLTIQFDCLPRMGN